MCIIEPNEHQLLTSAERPLLLPPSPTPSTPTPSPSPSASASDVYEPDDLCPLLDEATHDEKTCILVSATHVLQIEWALNRVQKKAIEQTRHLYLDSKRITYVEHHP